MKVYINEGSLSGKRVVLDDMILTTALPTTAGSKMLEHYVSLFEAEAVTRLEKAGYTIGGKLNVGEFGIDLLGETSFFGACVREDGTLASPAAESLNSGAFAAVQLDVNGAPRRAAAQNGCVCVKPTYGTVSRYGTIPAACSGETLTVTAASVAACREVLSVLAGHDDKDGTSLPAEKCALLRADADRRPVRKVAVAAGLTGSADAQVQADVAAMRSFLESNGIEVVEIDDQILTAAKTAWNVLMSAELCNNVSRYDGVKFGYRSSNYTNIDELYTNSRTEAFGELLKTAILFGSDMLSTDNYMKMYDKALRIRRVIVEALNGIFAQYDALLLPACSAKCYALEAVQQNKYLAFQENVFTAPASISGMPAVIVGGVQLMGPAFSENSLLDLAQTYGKEGQ